MKYSSSGRDDFSWTRTENDYYKALLKVVFSPLPIESPFLWLTFMWLCWEVLGYVWTPCEFLVKPGNLWFFICQNTRKVCKVLSIWESSCIAAEVLWAICKYLGSHLILLGSIFSILMNFLLVICMPPTEINVYAMSSVKECMLWDFQV